MSQQFQCELIKQEGFNNPIFGEKQPYAVHVKTVHEEYNQFAKLEFMIISEDGTVLLKGNETISGEDYANWDGNDLKYPYTFVASKRGFEIDFKEEE